MKTSKFLKTLAIMLSMVMSISLWSCGDDEPDNNGNNNNNETTEYIQGEYIVTLSNDYYKFYDITLTYVDVNGQQVTQALTSNADFLGSKVLYSKANKDITFKVEATLKSSLPAYDDTDATTYNFDVYCIAKFFKFESEIKVGDMTYRTTSPVDHKTPMGGSKLEQYLTKYSTRTLCDCSLSL